MTSVPRTALRGRRLVMLSLAGLVIVGTLALPASAATTAESVPQSITNDPGANLCVYGTNYVSFTHGDSTVDLISQTLSNNYGCSVPKNLGANYLATRADLYYGGYPDVVLCGLGHAYVKNPYYDGDSNLYYMAAHEDTIAQCGQSTLYWGIGQHQLYVYPGVWYPSPAKATLSGPVNGY